MSADAAGGSGIRRRWLAAGVVLCIAATGCGTESSGASGGETPPHPSNATSAVVATSTVKPGGATRIAPWILALQQKYDQAVNLACPDDAQQLSTALGEHLIDADVNMNGPDPGFWGCSYNRDGSGRWSQVQYSLYKMPDFATNRQAFETAPKEMGDVVADAPQFGTDAYSVVSLPPGHPDVSYVGVLGRSPANLTWEITILPLSSANDTTAAFAAIKQIIDSLGGV